MQVFRTQHSDNGEAWHSDCTTERFKRCCPPQVNLISLTSSTEHKRPVFMSSRLLLSCMSKTAGCVIKLRGVPSCCVGMIVKGTRPVLASKQLWPREGSTTTARSLPVFASPDVCRRSTQTHWVQNAAGALAMCSLVSTCPRSVRQSVRSLRFSKTKLQAVCVTESAQADAQAAANEVLAAVGPRGPGPGFAVVLIPRRLSTGAPGIVQHIGSSLGAAVSVVACTSGGPTLQLGVMDVQPGLVAEGFSLTPDTVDADLQKLGGSPGSVFLLGDPAISAPGLARTLGTVDKKWPASVKSGMMAAPPEQPGGPAVWINGKAVPGGFVGLLLPGPASAMVDLLGCVPVGGELEIFEADVQRGKPPALLQIGTDQEGDYRDVAETEKGTAGIPRRVGIMAAQALKSVMEENKLGGPKEILLGLSRPTNNPTNPTGNLAAAWSLFNWVGVSKSGAAMLAGGDPVAEGLMPTGALRMCQCFRVAPASATWQRLLSQCQGPARMALALAGGRGIAPKEGASMVAAGGTPALGGLGMSVIGSAAPGAPLAIHRQAALIVTFSGP